MLSKNIAMFSVICEDDMFLSRHNIGGKRHAVSRAACVDLCLQQTSPLCMSVDYDQVTQRCFLKEVNRYQAPQDYRSSSYGLTHCRRSSLNLEDKLAKDSPCIRVKVTYSSWWIWVQTVMVSLSIWFPCHDLGGFKENTSIFQEYKADSITV